MKVTLQKQEKNQILMEVEVEASQVSDTYQKRFREASRSVNIPGFRKGKAPKQILEKYIHADMIKQDVLEHLVSESYSEALRSLEEPIEPISEPQIELVKFDLNEPLIFKAMLEVKPEVKLGQYKDLNLQVEALSEISDKEVAEELEALRKRYGELIVVDRPIQENDVATLDIYGEVEGEPIPQGATDNLDMEVRPGNFVPGFTEKLIGTSANEEKSIDITFPDDYAVVDLRQKQGLFKVSVKEVKELKLPELNDEFAKKVAEGNIQGEINTLDELKVKLQEELGKNQVSAQKIKNQQSLIENIVESSEVEVPDSMIQRELYAMWSNTEGKTLSERNIAKEVLQASWENWTAREDMKEEAEKRIKTTLVLSEIAKTENISVTADELNSELRAFSSMYQVPAEQLREELIKNNRMIPLIDELLSLKIINWIESNSKVNVSGQAMEQLDEAKSDETAKETVAVDTDEVKDQE
ncbi:MAG: trigger factor [Candidatus Sericytochromatia bacterium]|nr:trigger factor [Candidatus Sericytochromatia bacterium]